MPPNWEINNDSYWVIINPNDNAIRFAEWPRSNPGSFAGLDVSIREGETANMLVLLTNYPYHENLRNNHGDSYRLRVRSTTPNFRQELAFANGNNAESRWADVPGVLQIRTRPMRSVNGHLPGRSEPVTAAFLRVTAREDGIREGDETIELTLEHHSNIPPYWGSITNLADTGSPPVETSSVFRITILGDESIGFAEETSEVVEGSGTPAAVTVNIFPTLSAPASIRLTPGGTAREGVDYTIASEHYNSGTDTLTLPANTQSFDITVTPIDDAEEGDNGKTIIFTLADPGGNLPGSRAIETGVHTVTIRDDDRSIGFTTTEPSASANAFTEGQSLTVNVAPDAGDAAAFAALGLSGDIELAVSMSVTGDTDLRERDRPGHENSGDYTYPATLTLDRNTGAGSFTFTANEDTVAEGIEYVTLSIDDNGNLPLGWSLGPDEFTIPVAGSDNAARFAEWPRGNPGSFAPLSATITEGDAESATNLNVLLANYAPHGDLPVLIDVEDGHESDVAFENVDAMRSSWDDTSNTFTVRRSIINEAPNLGAGLKITAPDDNIDEGTEEVTITLRQPVSGFPVHWGAVAGVADVPPPGENMVATSLTFELTILDDDAPGQVGFAPEGEVRLVEAVGDHSTISDTFHDYTINLTSPAPTGGLRLSPASSAAGEVAFSAPAGTGGTYDASSNIFTVLEGRVRATLRVTATDDADVEGIERTDVTLSKATGFDDNWGVIDAGNRLRRVRIEANDRRIQFSAAERQLSVIRNQDVTLKLVVNDSNSDHALPVRISVGGAEVYHDVVPATLGANEVYDVTFPYPEDSSPTASEATFTLESATHDDGSTRTHFPRNLGWRAVGNVVMSLPITDSVIRFVGERTEIEEGGTATVTLSIIPPLERASVVTLDFAGSPLSTAFASLEVGGVPVPIGIASQDITLPANDDKVVFTVNANPDDNDVSEALHLNISQSALNPLPAGRVVGTPSKHVVQITDDEAAAGTVNFAYLGRTVDETAARYTVELLIEGHTLRSEGEYLGMTITGGEGGDITLGGAVLVDPLVLPGANPGENAYFTIDIEDDADIEDDEQITFTLPATATLSGGEKLALGRSGRRIDSYTLTIRASDNIARFASSSATVAENDGTHTLRVRLDNYGAPSRGLPLTITADGDTDAVVFDGSVSIAEGGTGADVTVNIVHDVDVDGEQVTFTLGEGANFPSAWGGIDSTGNTFVLDITDTGTTPPTASTIGFSEQSSTAPEPNDNRYGANPGGDATFEHTVTLDIAGNISANHTLPVSVSGTATKDGTLSDFEVPASVILTPGDSNSNGQVSFNVTIKEDVHTEEAETIILTISPDDLPTDFTLDITYPSHTITIPANDLWVFVFGRDENGVTANTIAADETDTSVTLVASVANVNIPAPAGGIPVKLEVTSGNAGGEVSFSNSGPLNEITAEIPAGDTQVSVPLYIKSDVDTDDETVVILLSEDTGFPAEWGYIPQNSGVHEVTVNINDTGVHGTPEIGFAEAAATVYEGGERGEGGNVTHTVNIETNATIPSGGQLLRLAVGGTATDGDVRLGNSASAIGSADRSIEVTVLPPASGEAPGFDLVINDDTAAEDEETLTLTFDAATLAGLPGFTAGSNTVHTITIPANDNAVYFSSTETNGNAATVLENAGTATLPVLLRAFDAPVGGLPLTLSVTDRNGNPAASDKVSLVANGSASTFDFSIFPADGRRKDVTVYLNPDIDTNNDIVYFTLKEQQGATFPRGWGVSASEALFTLSITDNNGIFFAEERTEVEEEGRAMVVLSIVPPLERASAVEVDFTGSPLSSGYATLEVGGASVPIGIASQEITLPANQDEVVFTVTAQDDDNDVSEALHLNISESGLNPLPAGWSIGTPSKHVVQISDDETAVGTVNFVSLGRTVDETAASITVELLIEGHTLRSAGEKLGMTITGGEDGDITLGGAKLEDPTVLPGANPGENAYFTIEIQDDADREEDERIIFTLPSTAVLSGGERLALGRIGGGIASYVLTIRASDNIARFATNSATVAEDAGTYTLNLQLEDHGAPSRGLPLTLTASGDTDAVLFDGNVSIAEGESTAAVAVNIVHDVDDDDEQVTFTLGEGANFPSAWGGIDVTRNTFTLDITDAGTQPPASTIGFNLAATSVNEPNDNRYGTGTATRAHPVMIDITGTISANHTLPVNVSGTAAKGSDFEAPANVILTPGDSGGQVSFTVIINEDADVERDPETIILSIDEGDLPPDFTLDSSYPVHTVTIPVNDLWVVVSGRDGNGLSTAAVTADETAGSVPLFVSVADPSVPAPAGGIPVKLEAVSVIGAGDEVSFSEFEQRDEITATIPEGGTEVEVPVYINPDVDTDTEVVVVTLSEGTNFPFEWGIIPQNSGVHQATISITDTGAHAPSIGFAEAAATVHEGGEGGGNATHTVSIQTNAAIPSGGHLLRLAVGGTALDGDVSVGGSSSAIRSTDGSIEVTVLRPAPGEAPGFDLVINDDATAEDEETLTLTFDAATLAGLPGFTAGSNPAYTITIPANDNVAYFSSTETNGNAATVLENAGTVTLPVLLRTIDAPAGGLPLTLSVTDRNGNPVASDKVSLVANGSASTVDFRILPADGRRKDVTVYLKPDIDTNNDTVYFTLTEQQGATPAFPRGWSVSASESLFTLSITDNNGIFFAEERTEVEEGGTARVVLSIVPPLERASVVDLDFTGSAFFSGYATLKVGNRTVAIGSASQEITLPADKSEVVLNVTANEDGNDVSEALHLNISESALIRLPAGWSIGTPSKHVVQINDDDTVAGTVNFSSPGRTVDETAGSYTVELLIEGHTLRSAGENLGMTIAGGGGGDITLGGASLADPLVLPGANPGDNAYFTIDIEDDADREGDERITFTLPSTVTLSGGERLALGRSGGGSDSYVLTIRASDNIARFATPSAVVAEDVGTYTLNLQLDDHGAPSRGLPLTLTASGDTDAVLFDGNVSIAEGGRTAEVAVRIVHDGDSTPERVTFTLGEGANFPSAWGGIVRSGNNFTLAITDDGTPPSASTIGFSEQSSIAIEPNDNRNGSGTATLTHTVMLDITGTLPANHKLPILISGTATRGPSDPPARRDFFAPMEVDLMPGDSSATYTVTINEDTDVEREAETIILSIDEDDLPPGFTLDSSYPVHTITIPANDLWVIVSGRNENGLPTFTVTADETDGSVSLFVSVADANFPAPEGGIPVILRTTSGNDGNEVSFSATRQSDETTATIPAGGTEVEVPVYINPDSDTDPEKIVIELNEGANFPTTWGFIPRSSGVHEVTINITDNNSIFFAEERTEIREGGTATVTLSIEPPLEQEAFVIMSFSGSSIPYDYATLQIGNVNIPVSLGGQERITLPAGAHEVVFNVTANQDEDDVSEALYLNISESGSDPLPVGWSIGTPGRHVVQFEDDDGTYSFARAGSTVDEPSGTQGVPHTIEIEINGTSLPAGSSDLGMTIGGATGDVSYNNDILENHLFGGNKVLVLPGANAGDNARFTIDINPDAVREADETVTFTLPSEITLGSGERFTLERFGNETYTLTIRANDNVARFAPGSNSATVAEIIGITTISVNLDAAPAPVGELPLTLTANGDTDAVVFDGNFTVPAGGQAATVTIGIVHDSDNQEETVTFTLGEGANFPRTWGGVDSTGTFVLTITDDGTDPPGSTIGFSEQTSTALEPNDNRYGTGTATLTHTVMLDITGTLSANHTLPVIIGGTAASGSDFEAPSSVTLTPGDSDGKVSFIVTIKEDTEVEREAETVTLSVDVNDLPDGFELDTTYPVHTITIPANDLWVGLFSRNDANVDGRDVTVDEGAGPVTLVAKLLDVTVPAPVGGVPVRFEATSGNDGDEVSFSATRQIDATTATIPAGGTEVVVPVFIKADADTDLETVVITLSEGANFPTTWGLIPQNSGVHQVTINIVDASPGNVGFALPADEVRLVEAEGDHSTVRNTFHDYTISLTKPAPAGGLDLTLFAKDSGTVVVGEDVSFSAPNSTEATYEETNDVFTVLAGRKSATLRVTAIDDAEVERRQRVDVEISPFSNSWGSIDVANSLRTLYIERSDRVIQFSPRSEQLALVRNETVTLRLVVNDANTDHALPVRISVDGTGVYDEVIPVTLNANATYDVSFAYPSVLAADARNATFTLEADTRGSTTPDFPQDLGWRVSGNTSLTLPIGETAGKTIGFREQSSVVPEPNDNRYGTNPGGDATFEHTVTLDIAGIISANHALPILVSGTATSGPDFEAPSNVALTSANSGGTASLTVTIKEDAATERTPESIILTIDGDNLPPDFTLDRTYPSHTITIPVNDLWVALFSRNDANVDSGEDVTVVEGADPVTLVVKLLDVTVPAPAGGVPVRLEAVSGNENNGISFREGEQFNAIDVTVPAGGTEVVVPVFIKSNVDVAGEEVTIRMTEGANFPTTWGFIPRNSGVDERTITIIDGTTVAPAPPRLPDPVRPPTQETSPKEPPDEFQKEADAPVPLPLPAPVDPPTQETSPADPPDELQKEAEAPAPLPLPAPVDPPTQETSPADSPDELQKEAEAPAPLPLPAPVDPPTQETSPADPPDELQKEAEAPAPLPLPAPVDPPTQETSPADPPDELQKEAEAPAPLPLPAPVRPPEQETPPADTPDEFQKEAKANL